MPKHGTYPENILDLYSDLNGLFDREIDIGLVTPRSDPLYRWEVFLSGKPLYEDIPGRFEEEYRIAGNIFRDTEKFRRLEWEIIMEKYE